ncbi:unnamed protein product, partial [Calicophoron daubneyi]
VVNIGSGQLAPFYGGLKPASSFMFAPLSDVLAEWENQAKQRAGRVGRTAPGCCYRLYTEDYFKNEMPLDVKPEIQRASLAGILLQLKAAGIKDINSLEFMDPPSEESISVGEELLRIIRPGCEW